MMAQNFDANSVAQFLLEKALNDQAKVALSGFSATPEKELADFLRSGVEIAADVRSMIADALEGKLDGIELKATGRQKTKWKQSYASRRKNIHLAKDVSRLQNRGLNYEDAVEKVSIDSSLGIKTIEASITYLRKYQKWLAEVVPKIPDTTSLSESYLLRVWIFADLAGKDPYLLMSRAVDVFDQFSSFELAIGAALDEP